MVRPRQVGEWITAHRRFADVVIDNVSAFRADWWAWWTSIQPQDRCRSPMLPPTNTMDWVPLRKCGKDGIILFIYALRWWGVTSLADADWQAAALDAKQVLACLLAGYTNPISSGAINGTILPPTTLTPGCAGSDAILTTSAGRAGGYTAYHAAVSNTPVTVGPPIRQTRAVTAANRIPEKIKAVAPLSKSKWKGWVEVIEEDGPDVSDTGSSPKRRRIE